MVHEMVAQNHGWLISQFMHGEQGALVATAKICAAAESIDDKYYAAAQVADEARHVEAYQRYLDKIGVTYPVSPPLHTLLEQVMGHRHVDMTFLGMQILVEGVALAAFSLGGAMLANPLIGTSPSSCGATRRVTWPSVCSSLQGRTTTWIPSTSPSARTSCSKRAR